LRLELKPFRPWRSAALGLAAVTLAAWAATYGPFHVSAAGKTYLKYTFAADEVVEYQAAQSLARIYLAPILITPQKIYDAIENDYIRVVYYDGQIYDYKIQHWPSSRPVGAPTRMSTATQIHLSPRYQQALHDCNMGRTTHESVTLNTGYWGVQEIHYADRDELSTAWVSTGTRTYDFDDCGGK
jgi:hypothetical protein